MDYLPRTQKGIIIHHEHSCVNTVYFALTGAPPLSLFLPPEPRRCHVNADGVESTATMKSSDKSFESSERKSSAGPGSGAHVDNLIRKLVWIPSGALPSSLRRAAGEMFGLCFMAWGALGDSRQEVGRRDLKRPDPGTTGGLRLTYGNTLKDEPPSSHDSGQSPPKTGTRGPREEKQISK